MGKEKGFREEDLKQLEAEIDSAVERLFVAKQGVVIESLPTESPRLEPLIERKGPSTEDVLPSVESMESSVLELSSEMEKSLGALEEPPAPPEKEPRLEAEVAPSAVPPASQRTMPSLLPRLLESLESQLLSLEWEITTENLEKTRKEIRTLRDVFQKESDVSSILHYMESVLGRMVIQGATISPPLMKFLLDSKDTIKLFLKKESNEEFDLYWRLAYEGIKARFASIELSHSPTLVATPRATAGSRDVNQAASAGPKMVEELSNALGNYFGKVDERFKKIDQYLASLNEWIRNASEQLLQRRSELPRSIQVTVFKVDGRLFGVPSEKVFKLFKVPASLQERFSNQQRIRLGDMDVKMVDLRSYLSFSEEAVQKERRILIVKDDREFKGFLIDQVLDRVSAHSMAPEGHEAYASELIQWTYEQQPMGVPVLNLKKL